MADRTVTVGEKIELQVAALRSDNVKVPTADRPVWSVDFPAVGELFDISANGAQIFLRAISPGTVTVSVTAEAITKTLVVDVVAATVFTTTDLTLDSGPPIVIKPLFSGFPP